MDPPLWPLSPKYGVAGVDGVVYTPSGSTLTIPPTPIARCRVRCLRSYVASGSTGRFVVQRLEGYGWDTARIVMLVPTSPLHNPDRNSHVWTSDSNVQYSVYNRTVS